MELFSVVTELRCDVPTEKIESALLEKVVDCVATDARLSVIRRLPNDALATTLFFPLSKRNEGASQPTNKKTNISFRKRKIGKSSLTIGIA